MVKIKQMKNIWGEIISLPDSTKIGAFVDIGNPDFGENCNIQAGVTIPPGWKFGKEVFIGPGANFANDKTPYIPNENFKPEKGLVGDNAVIGMNASIGAGLTIGERAIIGMGAVLTKSVPAGETWVGSPASRVGSINKYWLLGLIEGEGWFSACKNKTDGRGYTTFQIGVEMNEDRAFFETLQKAFGGSLYDRKQKYQTTHVGEREYQKKGIMWQVRKTEEVKFLIELLEPLKWRTKKRKDFDLFREQFFHYKGLSYGKKTAKKLNKCPLGYEICIHCGHCEGF